MKKFFKALALVLALALVIGVVPAQATSAKIKTKKTLYVDGAKGTSTDGKLESSYKERVAIYKLAGAKKADKEDHTFRAKIKSGDSVTVSKNYVYAAGLGKSVVELFKDGESLGTTVITVKKNATEDTLTITELEDGKEVVCGVEYTVTLPRKGVDTDERRLFVDDKAVEDKEDAPRAYAVKFTKAGDHKVKFEAFQSAELDKATASKEITVKAVMPQPVSAKQVSASSFAVEFEGNMEGLITKDDITNQMIYYLIASQPVVTGVVKAVEVKNNVVTVTMYANFNSDTDYYFAYGSVDPIKFHTAKNDIKYATSLKLVAADAYYVGSETDITYKFYNADGVELAVNDIPAIEVTSDYGYGIGTKIYFHAEGPATIKASIVTGYDDETNVANVLTDTITVNGVKKTTTQTGKVYSFGNDVTKAKHSIRIGDASTELRVKYTVSDGTTTEIQTIRDKASFYLKSTDETVAMIDTADKNLVYGVNTGTATIVLYDRNDDSVLDAFQITVLEANKADSATATLSKETLNLWATAADTITLTVAGLDRDGANNTTYAQAYTAEVQQLENNDVATKVKFKNRAKVAMPAAGADGKTTLTFDLNDFDVLTGASEFSTIRIVVTVKDNTSSHNVLLSKTLSFVVSEQDASNAHKLKATANALDTSVKDWGSANLDDVKSTVTVDSVKTTAYGDFFIAHEDFWLITSINDIPVTGTAAEAGNYVVYSYPSSDGTAVATAGALYANNGDFSSLTVDGFLGTTDRARVGSYTFTGYNVVFDGANGEGTRSTLGTQSVVVSKSDVLATVEVVNGKATNFKDNKATAPQKIFKVTWGDLTTNENNDGRVVIVALEEGVDKNFNYDTQSQAYYCRNIKVKLEIEKNGADSGVYTFYQTINVNKLFKND